MECSPLCFGKIRDSQCLPPSLCPSQLKEAQPIVLLEVAQDVVTLGYPVAQRSPKLGPALAKPLFTLQILTTDRHSGVATCAIRAYGHMCVCVVCVVCVCVRGLWYTWTRGMCGVYLCVCVRCVCRCGVRVYVACSVCVVCECVCGMCMCVFMCICVAVYVYTWCVWGVCGIYMCVVYVSGVSVCVVCVCGVYMWYVFSACICAVCLVCGVYVCMVCLCGVWSVCV